MKATHKLVGNKSGDEWLLANIEGQTFYKKITGSTSGLWWKSRNSLDYYGRNPSFTLSKLVSFKGNK